MIGGRWSEHTTYENRSLAKAQPQPLAVNVFIFGPHPSSMWSTMRNSYSLSLRFVHLPHRDRSPMLWLASNANRLAERSSVASSSLQWHTRSVYAENLSCAHCALPYSFISDRLSGERILDSFSIEWNWFGLVSCDSRTILPRSVCE